MGMISLVNRPARRLGFMSLSSWRGNRASIMDQFWIFLRPPPPPAWFKPPPWKEVIVSKLIGAVSFFWIFYIMRKEGKVMLVLKSHYQAICNFIL